MFAGVVNGKNIWRNHYEKTTNLLQELTKYSSQIVLNTSCSLLHVPYTCLLYTSYILYQSEYDALVANKAEQPKTEKVTIAGKCCESGDLIGENMEIQKCEVGDIIAVCATGAYNYSMASNYNRLQKPAVVFVKGGEDRLAVKRESLDDLLRNDI